MKVVITGGLGFLGQRLARALLERETLTGASGEQERIDEMILFDAVVPDQRRRASRTSGSRSPQAMSPMGRRCARSSRETRSRSFTSLRW